MLLLTFIVLLGFLLWYFSHKLAWGFYILVALAPIMHWTFYLSDFRFLLENHPELLGFYAPVVDVWAAFMVAAVAVSLVGKWWRGEKINLPLPGGWFYFLFLLTALISCLNLFPGELSSSLKYIIRFPLFVYLGFVVVGLSALDSREMLYKSMKIFVGVCFLGAVMGLISLFTGAWSTAGLIRAVPFALGQFTPFGDQHIFLAEVFVAALPICLYFYFGVEDKKQKKWWLLLFFFILLICLLTFSRAGWLTLLFMGILVLWLERPQTVLKYLKNKIWFFVLMLIPFAAYMFWFLQSKVVQFSNEARVAIASIGWYLFTDHPIIGQGVGTFISRLSDIQYFVYEFGDAIDAHSIIIKLLAEQGILGLIAFALFVGYFLKQGFIQFKKGNSKLLRANALLSLVLISGVIFFQFFSTQYYAATMWVPFVFGIALLKSYAKN